MKELLIEEKAKRYDEALKVAIVAHKDEDRHLKATLERIFPELKGSEDEEIRKEIISIIRTYRESCITEGNHRFDNCIAWLEKQGEQKPVDIDKEIEDYINSNFFEGSDGGMISDNHRNIGGVTYSDLANLARHFSSSNKQNRGNEDDESMRTRCINALYKCYMGELPQTVVEEIEWLKSLKDRYTWKPSDEQMDVLLGEVSAWTKGCPKQIVLESLYNDLKKLREE